jgi:hypothetical protein
MTVEERLSIFFLLFPLASCRFIPISLCLLHYFFSSLTFASNQYFLWKAADRKVFVIFLNWTQRKSVRVPGSDGFETTSLRGFEVNQCEKEISTVSDLFPIQFHFNETDYSIKHPQQKNEVLELYEVYSSTSYEATPKATLVIADSATAENSSTASNPSPLRENSGMVFAFASSWLARIFSPWTSNCKNRRDYFKKK